MLGYRSFFRFRDEPRAEEALNGQLSQWLKSKNWDAEKLVEGSTQRIAPNVTGTLVRVDADAARNTRFVFEEDGQGGKWTTSLTLHIDAGGSDGWVWFDIDSPAGGPQPRPPRLAGTLLRSATGRDGDHVLTGTARIARTDQVDELIAAITDPRRRGLLFLAGTSDALPLDEWAKYVRKILRDTVGLASSYILDAEATALLNAELPASHRIAPGTVRTFRPGVDLDDPVDGVRHRYLTTERILRANQYALRGLLAHQASELSTSAPLPGDAVAVDELLRASLDDALVDSAAPTVPEVPRAGAAAAATELKSAHRVEASPFATDFGPAPSRLLEQSALTALSTVLTEVLGTESVDAEAIWALGVLARRAQHTSQARDSLQERMRTIEAERKAAENTVDRLRRSLEEEQLYRAEAENNRAEAERQLRLARMELAKSGQPEVAWSTPPTDPLDVRPESMEDLLSRIGELDHIVFTGDNEKAHGLDQHDPMGAWAGRTWDALLALEDYCQVSLDGSFRGSVHLYLTKTPAGCHGFSTGGHVPGESKSVRNSSKFAAPRTLPVPAEVDASGQVFMDAHFRISGASTISPRMQYYDDAARTGRIYVGYIGPHLPNTLTN